MTNKRRLATRLLVGMASCWSIAAIAADAVPNTSGNSQAAADDPATQLQEVTVSSSFISSGGKSALKMAIPVRDVPFSLEDYSNSFMQAVDTTRLTDLYGYMSGVQRAGVSGYDVNIRGFTSSSEDPNSILVDGLPGLPARTASPESADIERVEVVKGPASVLYGQDEPGGFINLITKKPQARPETTVEARADTYDGAGVSFGEKNGYTGIVDTTGALDHADRFLGRAIVQYTNAQSFRQFVLDKDVMVAPGLTWNISSRTKATLLLEYRHGNDSYDSGLVVPGGIDARLIAPIITRYQNPQDKEMEKGETATLLLHHAFSQSLSWDINARSVYTEDYEIGFDNKAILDLETLERADKTQDNHHHFNFLDTSVTDIFHTGPIGHRVLAGLSAGETIEDYNRIRNFATKLLNIAFYNPVPGWSELAPAVEPPQSHTWGGARSYGAYATDLMTFTRHWKGVVGVRYEDVEETQKELRLPDVPVERRSFNDAFPMGGVIYQPTQQWSLYGSYSTSYVPPPSGAQSYISGQTLNAQSANQEEVGAKFESKTGRASATLSLFNIKESNLIQVIGHTGLYEQVGSVRSRGVELELDLRPTPWWQVNANYALVDARIIDSVVANQIGAMSLNSPRNSASVLSRIQFRGRLSSFGWMLGVIYRSERAGSLPDDTQPSQFIMPGYSTVDTGIYYNGDAFNASVKVSNVLDKQYFQSAYSNLRVTPGDPRNFALTVSKVFD